MKKGITIVIVATIGAMLLLGIISTITPTRSSQSTQSSVRPAGTIITLPNIFLGTSRASYDRLVKLSTARDEAGIKDMISSGAAFVVQDGTKAKIIDNGILVIEVRIEDGSHSGKSGWISRELTK